MEEKYHCQTCLKGFSCRQYLQKHNKTIHGIATLSVCEFCQKTFSCIQNLRRHKKKVHGLAYLKEKSTSGLFSCQEEECDQTSFRFANELRDHLTENHDVTFCAEELMFECEEDFLKWKEMIEGENMAFYSANGGRKKKDSNSIKYYCCNRSGKYESQSKGKRFPRESGKIGFNCTSTMKTVQDLNSGHITVIFHRRHYGHTFSFRHIRLPEKERLNIAEKIKCKGSLKEVLNEIRGPIGALPLKRLHFATIKDIQNIKRAYSLKRKKCKQDDDDDPKSVHLMTESFKEFNQDNPILCSKLQGETLESLTEDEVFFVIQYPLQKQMLNKYGNDAICTHSTYGTNASNFIVITLLVIDKFQQGFPVAWCIANRQDNIILKKFVEAIKENNSNEVIEPRYFLSDMDSVFYDVWCDVFGGNAQKLMSTFHLHKTLNNQLQILIPNNSLMGQVQSTLYDLIEEPDSEKFEERLSDFVEDLNFCEGTEKFAEYFTNDYANHTQEWAHCYRSGSCLTTNNYMETFHKDFKPIYLDEKVNKQLDTLISFLTHTVYNKAVDQMIRQEKGLSSRITQKITNRHRSSNKLDLSSVRTVPDAVGQYIVISESQNQQHHVDIITDPCEINCAIKCSSCSICIHQVKCTCDDFLTNSTICKHAHLICRFIKTQNNTAQPNQQSDTNQQSNLNQQSEINNFDNETILETVAKDVERNSLKEEIANQLQCLKEKLGALDGSDVDINDFLKVKEVLQGVISL